MKWILLLSLIAILHRGNAQKQLDLRSTHVKMTCGLESSYSGRVKIINDTLTLYRLDQIEQIVNQYFVLEQTGEWKKENYDGKFIYKTRNIADQSEWTMGISLKNGKGTLKIFKEEQCEIIITIEQVQLSAKSSKF